MINLTIPHRLDKLKITCYKLSLSGNGSIKALYLQDVKQISVQKKQMLCSVSKLLFKAYSLY